MTSSISTIRKATPADLRQVKKIDHLLFGEDSYPVFALRQLLDITGGLSKVAVQGKDIVGYAIGHFNPEKAEAWFLSLGVLPDYGGKKIGERLVSTLLEEVSAMGAALVYLTVHPDNVKGIRIYKRLGFKTKETVEDYYLDNSPRLIMAKEITQPHN